jgi:peptidyl-prolyl cis-trans isomerase C
MTRSPAWIVALALAFAGCGAPKQDADALPYPKPDVVKDGKVVAKVGDVALTTEEIERRIQQQSPFVRGQLRDPGQKKKFVENEVRLELLAQEGWRRGLYKDPKVLAELKRAIVQRVMRDEMQSLASSVNVSEEELIQAYKKNEADYVKPEKIRVSQILIRAGNDADRKAAKKKLEGLRDQIAREEREKKNELAFSDAARAHSEDDATKRAGGDLQFLGREEITQRFGAEAAAELFEKREIGEVIVAEIDAGVVLLRKTGKRRAVERTLEMVKPQLRGQVLGEKRNQAFDAYVEELKKKTGVTIDDSALADVEISLDKPTASADGAPLQQAQPTPAQPPPQENEQ